MGELTVQEKADKYDELENLIAGFYMEDDGLKREDDFDEGLIGIGEATASFFGFL